MNRLRLLPGGSSPSYKDVKDAYDSIVNDDTIAASSKGVLFREINGCMNDDSEEDILNGNSKTVGLLKAIMSKIKIFKNDIPPSPTLTSASHTPVSGADITELTLD